MLVDSPKGWKLIIARTSIVALMSRINVGRLRILAPEQVYEFGTGEELSAELKVINDAFWVRLLLLGDLVYHIFKPILMQGFAEAYMLGDVVCDDLVAAFKVHYYCELLMKDVSCQSS
jgi:cyclopropane-fatty-acyl-phospholipid synthase